MTREEIVRGFNRWMDAFILDADGFEAIQTAIEG